MFTENEPQPDFTRIETNQPLTAGVDLTPIVVLTARTAESQRLLAFDTGADDYVLKPFSAPELLARVRAVSRRHVRGVSPMAILRMGDISVDLTSRTARRAGGQELRLTPIEYRILTVLARHPESIVTQATILKEVWGPERDDSGSLRVFIASLRRKLEATPTRPKHIITELGLGYRLLLDLDPVADGPG
jgi:two-component system KDP operon response regulator KdpE